MNRIDGDGLAFRPLPTIESQPKSFGISRGEDGSFADALNLALSRVSGALHEADKTAADALVGEASPHQAMIAMAKADLQFRLMTQTRNKLVNAYRELMNINM